MSEENQPCPQCQSPYGYLDQNLWVCPECFHEWTASVTSDEAEQTRPAFVDAAGVPLQSGDTVRVVKDLKMGGQTIKSGTKVKGIRLLDEPIDGHDIACKIEGQGSVYLKCSVVKKL
jgi:protein PhnA